MDYRSWLQSYANDPNQDANNRTQARALLNVVGNDGNLDARFVGNQAYEAPGISRSGTASRSNWSDGGGFKYNITDMQNLNRDFLLTHAGTLRKTGNDTKETGGNIQDTGNTGGAVNRAPVPNDDARNLAYLEDQLRYMPGQLDRINQAQRNREGNIDNDYTLGLNQTNQAWGRAEQDHRLATDQRLKSRQRQVGVADEDFKKQNDAYGRYFSRIGAGSSSASQYAVPTLLSRAASKIRNEIEDTNQENAQLQTTAFNRAKEDKENNLSNLERERNRQKQAALSEFESKRSEYQKALADMQRQREFYKGRSYADVTAAAREAMEAAERHANEAVRAGQVTEGIKVNPIDYKAADQKGFEYDATQTKVETAPEEEDTANDAYSKYFRDEEERKKNSNLGWIAKQA